MKARTKSIVLGLACSNILGLGLLAASMLCAQAVSGAYILVASNFVIIPLLMGVVSAYFFHGHLTTLRQELWYALLNTCIAIGLSSLVLMEGAICLVIVFPILFGFVLLGTAIGARLIARNRRLGFHITPLALLILTTDSLSPPVLRDEVTDIVQIHAPPHVVWRYVPSFPRAESPARYWMFSLGLAEPLETQIEGTFVGAWRKCIFTGGLTFDETITEYTENQLVTFEVTKQPKDPEIFDHVRIERGQMSLHGNGDGTTTLTGTTWYQLRAFPAWYYSQWANSMGRAVHLKVMHHIKQLAEHDHRSSSIL